MSNPEKVLIPNRERLAAVLESTHAVISLNLATFWTQSRENPTIERGCLLGHYVKAAKPGHLELVPLNFLEQIKSPMLAELVFQTYPNTKWQHYTLHYAGPDVEAWGAAAACLYFQIRDWDLQTLFYPAGYNNLMDVEATQTRRKLDMFIRTTRVVDQT